MSNKNRGATNAVKKRELRDRSMNNKKGDTSSTTCSHASKSVWIDCTVDDYNEEIEQWQSKRQKILKVFDDHENRDKDIKEEIVKKEEQRKKLMDDWYEQEKPWFIEMDKKKTQLQEEYEVMCTEREEMDKEGTKLKETVLVQLGASFQSSYEHSKSLKFVKEVIQDENGLKTKCPLCSVDFSPLLYTPDVIGHMTTNCLECGFFLCNTCVIRNLRANESNMQSVGYECPRCHFFNCNTIATHCTCHDDDRVLPYEEFIRNPVVSGVSTSRNPHPYGRMLVTSNPKKIGHQQNVNEHYEAYQREFMEKRRHRNNINNNYNYNNYNNISSSNNNSNDNYNNNNNNSNDNNNNNNKNNSNDNDNNNNNNNMQLPEAC